MEKVGTCGYHSARHFSCSHNVLVVRKQEAISRNEPRKREGSGKPGSIMEEYAVPDRDQSSS